METLTVERRDGEIALKTAGAWRDGDDVLSAILDVLQDRGWHIAAAETWQHGRKYDMRRGR